MGRKQKFTSQQVIDACPGTAGIKALVAKKLGCDRSTIGAYAKRYVTVQRALDEADNEATDLAESKSMTLINEAYWPAIKYRLSTKGKDRGYVERQERHIEGTGKDGAVVFQFTGNIPKDGF